MSLHGTSLPPSHQYLVKILVPLAFKSLTSHILGMMQTSNISLLAHISILQAERSNKVCERKKPALGLCDR